jgi:hypothetical protein
VMGAFLAPGKDRRTFVRPRDESRARPRASAS